MHLRIEYAVDDRGVVVCLRAGATQAARVGTLEGPGEVHDVFGIPVMGQVEQATPVGETVLVDHTRRAVGQRGGTSEPSGR